MDLVASCRVFVHVADRASFTDGAAAARVPQSVASRRVAALEAHLGRRLFDRTTRRTALTPFGQDMLLSARRLVELAGAFEDDAERALLRPLTFAVPETLGVRALAEIDVAARAYATTLEFRAALPWPRAQLVRSREVRCGLIAVPASEATWTVRLGVAAGDAPAAALSRLELLRPSRGRRSSPRLWLQPEDDVPPVRDEARRAGHRAGLAPAQVAMAPTLAAAVSSVLSSEDLLLCSRAEAAALGLHWGALRDPVLVRGHGVLATDREDARLLTGSLWDVLARTLAADDARGAAAA
jgi:DNA-binding transcriptional LysR family regulator